MAIGQNPPFKQAASYYLSTSGASAGSAISVGIGDVAIVTNLSTANLYIWFSVAAQSLTVGSGFLVLPNSQRVIDLPQTASWVVTILDSATTGHAYVETGYGSAR